MTRLLFCDDRPVLFDKDWHTLQEPNEWLGEIIEDSYTPSRETWRAYAYDLGDFLTWCENVSKSWYAITSIDIVSYARTLRLKPRNFNRRIRLLFAYYSWATRNKLVNSVPFEVKQARKHRWRRKAHPTAASVSSELIPTLLRKAPAELDKVSLPTIEEIWRFRNLASTDRDKLIIEIISFVGLRLSELVGLCLSKFSTVYSTKGRASIPISVVGKGQRERTVFFPRGLVRAIQNWVELERISNRHAKDTDQLFIGSGGTLGGRAVEQMFDRLSASSSIDIYPHLLRHFFAVHKLKWLYDNDQPDPLGQLQAQLGHVSVETTRLYLRLLDEEAVQVAEDQNTFVAAISNGQSLTETFARSPDAVANETRRISLIAR